jgi:hypothetical protein
MRVPQKLNVTSAINGSDNPADNSHNSITAENNGRFKMNISQNLIATFAINRSADPIDNGYVSTHLKLLKESQND